MTTLSIAWVSGASSGIGAALAAQAPDFGQVIDVSRSGGTAGTVHLPADLSDPASWPEVVRAMSDTLAEERPQRAVFIHNAGTLDPIGPAHEVDAQAYTAQVLLDSAAPQVLGAGFLRAVAAVPSVTDAALVLISSGAATSAYEGWSAYGAGKAAVDQWVRTAGAEQARLDRGVRVLSIAPGVVATPMQEHIRDQDESTFPGVERFRQLHADGALTTPQEAAAAIWMITTDPTVSSGSVLDVRRLDNGAPPTGDAES